MTAQPIIIDQNKHVASDGSFRTAATTRGQTSGIISSQWFSRPDDQRYLDLDSLYEAVKNRADQCDVADVNVKDLEIIGNMEDELDLRVADRSGKLQGDPMAPTHWTFGQICSLVGAPSAYLRLKPSMIAAVNLLHDLRSDRREIIKVLRRNKEGDALPAMLAATSPTYGRIWDHETVDAVRKINDRMEEKTGRRLKVPGMIDWGSGNGISVRYNPLVEVTKQNTTLFASDHDVVLFLVDDTHPIQIGTLPDGSPDLVFRGIIVTNSEVGARSLKIMRFLLRGVCQNRCIWGGEQFETITVRHSKFAPEKFVAEVVPQIAAFANASTDSVVDGIQAAKDAILGQNDEEVAEWLAKREVPKKTIKQLFETAMNEEGVPLRSAWDLVNAMTANARSIPHQDERMKVEIEAGNLLVKAAKKGLLH